MPKDPTLSFIFSDDGTFQNNPLPLLLLKQAFEADPSVNSAVIEKAFHNNDWVNSWRNGLYSYHHYHSAAHEVLGIYSGWVKAQLGGRMAGL